MDQIKVLQLGSSSGLYGAERWILSMIKYLDANVIKSYVAAVVDDGAGEAPLCTEAKRHGFESKTFEVAGSFNLRVIRSLRSYIVDNQIDVVHSHGYKTDILGILSTVGLPCKTVSTPHGWTQNPDFKLRLYEWLDRALFPFLSKVVPLSNDLMKSISLVPARKALILNGVDIGEIDDLEGADEALLELKRDGGYLVGFIGRLVTGKGVDVLVDALSMLPVKVQVVIIGEGEEHDNLLRQAQRLGVSDRLHFLGFREDRLKLLKAFDVFVLPSRSEGIPRCVMESMAAEVPVIASDIPGCRVLIDGEQTGLLFKVDDPQSLADKARGLIENSQLGLTLSGQAKAFLERTYSAKRMAQEYQKLFLSL